MTAFVSFPDAEIAMLDYLRSAIPGIQCDVEFPKDYKASEGVYVAVRRAGGQARYPIMDYPLYDVQAYGPTRDAAGEAIQAVLAHIAVARYTAPVTGVFGQMSVITGPQYVPDPLTEEDRWQSLISIPLRGKRG